MIFVICKMRIHDHISKVKTTRFRMEVLLGRSSDINSVLKNIQNFGFLVYRYAFHFLLLFGMNGVNAITLANELSGFFSNIELIVIEFGTHIGSDSAPIIGSNISHIFQLLYSVCLVVDSGISVAVSDSTFQLCAARLKHTAHFDFKN